MIKQDKNVNFQEGKPKLKKEKITHKCCPQ